MFEYLLPVPMSHHQFHSSHSPPDPLHQQFVIQLVRSCSRRHGKIHSVAMPNPSWIYRSRSPETQIPTHLMIIFSSSNAFQVHQHWRPNRCLPYHLENQILTTQLSILIHRLTIGIMDRVLPLNFETG